MPLEYIEGVGRTVAVVCIMRLRVDRNEWFVDEATRTIVLYAVDDLACDVRCYCLMYT